MNNRMSLWLVLAAALLFSVYDSFYTVDQRERAVLFQFGEIVRGDVAPGLHLKLPFAQSVRRFDGRLKTLEDSNAHLLTNDQKDLQVVYYAKWKIADPAAYYRATNGGQDLVARDRLKTMLERGLRDAFAARSVAQLVADDQNAVAKALTSTVQEQVSALGLELADLRIESLQMPSEIADSVYERMRAERASLAAEARARGTEQAQKLRTDADQQAQTLLADAYRDAEKLRGEGDAKAAEIYARAYGQDPEFFRFYRSINAYRDIFHGDRDVLVLQPQGAFFRYFNDTPASGKH